MSCSEDKYRSALAIEDSAKELGLSNSPGFWIKRSLQASKESEEASFWRSVVLRNSADVRLAHKTRLETHVESVGCIAHESQRTKQHCMHGSQRIATVDYALYLLMAHANVWPSSENFGD